MSPPISPEPIALSRSARIAQRWPLRIQRRGFVAALIFLDLAALVAAFLVAYAVRFRADLPVFRTEVTGDPQLYATVVLIVLPVWLLLFAIAGLYDEHNLLGGTREYAHVFNATSAGMLFVVMATFLQPGFVIARGWLLLAWGLAFLWVAGVRFWLRRAVYRLRQRGWLLAPTLIVGDNEEALSLARQLHKQRASGLDLRGFVTAQPTQRQRVFKNLYQLGALADLPQLIEEHGIEEVVIATSALHRAELVEVFREINEHAGVRMLLSSGLFEVLTTGLRVKDVASTSLIEMRPVRLTGVDRWLKFVLDYGLASLAVLVGAPILVACALAVRLDSKGPIFHRRRVLGLGGGTFDALKFRSMRVDGDALLADRPDLLEQLQVEGKLQDDPRTTRVGRFLRKSSLDELPQFFNVLRGEMSVVGPRMISPSEHDRYGPWEMNLLTVKPGITGLWQISGRSDLSYEDRVRLDMNYIRNWTIWLDLQLLIQTIPAVLRSRGAY